jgi:hypothetical protein
MKGLELNAVNVWLRLLGIIRCCLRFSSVLGNIAVVILSVRYLNTATAVFTVTSRKRYRPMRLIPESQNHTVNSSRENLGAKQQ